MLWPPDSPWAPWWRTDEKTARAICKLANISKNDLIYDLGCGDGTVMLTAAKECGAQAVGIEIDPVRYLIARLRVVKNRLSRRIKIKRKNFFKEDFSKATVIVVYLVPKTLERLKPKFLKELSPGTRIISYRYEMSLLKKQVDEKNHLFLYTV